jgi:hypothetical protein
MPGQKRLVFDGQAPSCLQKDVRSQAAGRLASLQEAYLWQERPVQGQLRQRHVRPPEVKQVGVCDPAVIQQPLPTHDVVLPATAAHAQSWRSDMPHVAPTLPAEDRAAFAVWATGALLAIVHLTRHSYHPHRLHLLP